MEISLINMIGIWVKQTVKPFDEKKYCNFLSCLESGITRLQVAWRKRAFILRFKMSFFLNEQTDTYVDFPFESITIIIREKQPI